LIDESYPRRAILDVDREVQAEIKHSEIMPSLAASTLMHWFKLMDHIRRYSPSLASCDELQGPLTELVRNRFSAGKPFEDREFADESAGALIPRYKTFLSQR
jgi:hypothetical protein